MARTAFAVTDELVPSPKVRAMFADLPTMWEKFSNGDKDFDFPGAVKSLVLLATYLSAVESAKRLEAESRQQGVRVVFLQGKLTKEQWQKERGVRYLKPIEVEHSDG